MAEVGHFDSKCNAAEELCEFHNKLKGVFFRKWSISWKILMCILQNILKAPKTLTRAGKMALPSNSTAITLHTERSNIYRFWLVPVTNNSYNSSIVGSLTTLLIGCREAIKILTVAKWLPVKFGHELILLYDDYSARGIESDFPFAAIPCMRVCVGSSLILMMQAFGF